MYIFPGVALGAYLGDTRTISDSMLMRAAVTLPTLIKDEDLRQGYVYPNLKDIREITAKVALEVIKQAAEEGKVKNKSALDRLERGDAKTMAWINGNMFSPQYASLVQVPEGVAE